MFGFLTERFQGVFDAIAGRGKLRTEDVSEVARQIRLNLLAADVHVRVVKEFVDAVSARAVGKEVLESITPHQQFVKIVHDELVRVLGGESMRFDFAHKPPLVIMCVGLQGSGKTTTSAKFALWCRDEHGRRPLLVPADVHRPAAIEQLKKLAGDLGIACAESDAKVKPTKIAEQAVKRAMRDGFDTVIIDTAGRLHIDEEMMQEAKDIVKKIEPHHILYVADSMTGQDAAASASAFNSNLAITGIILTKLDGDAKGGAALSIRAVTGKPILFVGVGEKTHDFEAFHPDRMARRILGMGDVVSLVEKVERSIDQGQLEETAKSLQSGNFSLEDYAKQIKLIDKLGSPDKIMGMIPGMSSFKDQMDPDEIKRLMKRRDAILKSMTNEERRNPAVLNGSRRKRIAKGSGVEVSEVNKLIKEFEAMQGMMKKFARGGLKNLFKGLTRGGFSC